MSGTARVVFVTGTDTGVGKTSVTAALAEALRARGRRPAALKPVETGVRDGGDPNSDAARLAAATGRREDVRRPGLRRFAPPVSPHLAARAAGEPIDVAALARACLEAAAGADVVLVEGAGGLLVPLDDEGSTMADLALALGAELLVVARAGLGTINHTMLTLREAERRGLRVAGVVVNESVSPGDDASVPTNAREIARLAACPVWGPLPFGGGGAGWIEEAAPALVDALAG